VLFVEIAKSTTFFLEKIAYFVVACVYCTKGCVFGTFSPFRTPESGAAKSRLLPCGRGGFD